MGPSLIDVRRTSRRSRIGSKARSLARLQRLGFEVPRAWVLTSAHLLLLASDPGRFGPQVIAVLDPETSYAVRSSAEAEDGTEHSYAGRLCTLLDVSARDVPAAIARVASESDGEPARAYSDRLGAERVGTDLSVIVQELVRPSVAGVAFSRNPVTGIKETVIEAVPGSAEKLMSGVMRPERWVRKRSEWLLVPDEPALTREVAEQIADGVERIERAYGHPVDAEWAFDGRLWWLQARPITAGAQAAVFGSKLARDMLPGIILPLVWSINGPLNSTAFVRFLEDVFGPLGVQPSDLSALFHYRMYINIGALSRLFAEFGLPEESLEMLAGMERGASMPRMPRPTTRSLARVPHLARALMRFSRFDRELEATIPQLWQQSRGFAAEVDPQTLAAEDLFKRIGRLQAISTSSRRCATSARASAGVSAPATTRSISSSPR